MSRPTERTQPQKSPAEGKAFLKPVNLESRRKKILLVDLFAGIGGFHYGVAAASAEKSRLVDPILVSEIDSACRETYAFNHQVATQGDVKKLDLESGRTADILTAGFPCQPFSNSGLKKGLSDPRGQFYNRIQELILHYDTKSFILENVPGMRMNGGGRHQSKLSFVPGQVIGSTMQKLEKKLLELQNSYGYDIKWIELDSSHFGSPQVRKRVYIVGIKREYVGASGISLTFEKTGLSTFREISEGIEIPDMRLSRSQEENLRSFMKNPPSYKDGMRRVGNAYLCKGGNVGQGYHADGNVPTLTKVWARFLPIYFPAKGEKSPDRNTPQFIPCEKYNSGSFRRATVREAMRLQGFPDTFIPHESDRLAYEHAGNAVNALVVKSIAGRLLEKISK
jgi:DNA (cytosine-5)-methyltransferase 1